MIIVGTYQTEGAIFIDNIDNANFMQFENDHIIMQGTIITENSYTNKLEVSDYEQTTDKKGNIRITYQAMGRMINAKVTMTLKKA
ncbi:MAG: hypothetical protein R2756_02040 [Bacteroidales bacterium]